MMILFYPKVFSSFFRMTDKAISLLEFESIYSALNKLRNGLHPSCGNIGSFECLLETNEEIQKTFGSFKGQPFFRKTIVDELGSRSTVFVVEQFASILKNKAFSLYLDGTFSITPLKYDQLLVLFAKIRGRVRQLS